jgi:copper chaperone CopZ
MKTILAVALLSVFAAGCADSVAPTAPTKEEPAIEKPATENPAKEQAPEQVEVESVSYKLSITGMMCANCQAHVKKTLEEQPAVESADVNWKTGEAIIKVKGDAKFDEEAAKAALDKDMYKLTECVVSG